MARNIGDVKDLLALSDLVKFAKVTPDTDQNENNYDRVYYFVEDTKCSDSEVVNREKEESE